MISPRLHLLLIEARVEDMRRAAARRDASSPRATIDSAAATGPITLRLGFPDDRETVTRLAELDSSTLPAEPLLLAEVAGELRAALSLADGTAIYDPFHPSVELHELLHARARQLRGRAKRRRSLRLRRPLRATATTPT
jgi:hypothetical protein